MQDYATVCSHKIMEKSTFGCEVSETVNNMPIPIRDSIDERTTTKRGARRPVLFHLLRPARLRRARTSLSPSPPLPAHSPLHERGRLRPRRPRAPRARTIAPRERMESGSLERRLDPIRGSVGRAEEVAAVSFSGPEGSRRQRGRKKEEKVHSLTGNALRDPSLLRQKSEKTRSSLGSR